MGKDTTALSRAERRRRSDTAILAAAGELFAEVGYERTTIRAVAERAGVDPGLVTQNIGTKEQLFAAASRWSTPTDALDAATREHLPSAVLRHVLDAFESPQRRVAALALLRGSMTHETARAVLLREVMAPTQERVAATIDTDDAALRAALVNACMIGLTIGRHLIEDPVLVAADARALERVLLPAIAAITGGPPAAPAPA